MGMTTFESGHRPQEEADLIGGELPPSAQKIDQALTMAENLEKLAPDPLAREAEATPDLLGPEFKPDARTARKLEVEQAGRRQELKKKAGKHAALAPKEYVASVKPELRERWDRVAKRLLSERSPDREIDMNYATSELESLRAEDPKAYEKLLLRIEEESLLEEIEVRDQTKEAREIMGEDFFGPEEVLRAFGPEMMVEGLPPIPYSREELIAAKKRGEVLVLRVGRKRAKNSAYPENISERVIMEMAGRQEGGAKEIVSTEAAKRPDTGYVRTEWKLVGTKPVPGTVGKDLFDQTRALREYLAKNGLASEEELAECGEEQIKALEKKHDEQTGLSWQQKIDRFWFPQHYFSYNEQLRRSEGRALGLKINQNHLRSRVESLYDTVLLAAAGGENRFKKTEWTRDNQIAGNIGKEGWDSDTPFQHAAESKFNLFKLMEKAGMYYQH